jgi:hypothetical protein
MEAIMEARSKLLPCAVELTNGDPVALIVAHKGLRAQRIGFHRRHVFGIDRRAPKGVESRVMCPYMVIRSRIDRRAPDDGHQKNSGTTKTKSAAWRAWRA